LNSFKRPELTSAVAPDEDPNAVTKMSINGNPVADEVAATISSMLNKTVIIIAKPRIPLKNVENHMLKGMTLEACWISSAVGSLC
jgi:hypothetical protein